MPGKRKREPTVDNERTIQIVAGSYERVLHGFTAKITAGKDGKYNGTFRDTFMFNAHASAVRCLALSPESSAKRFLASGGTDERINLFQLSTRSSKVPTQDGAAQSLGIPTESTRNKELGSLLNHAQAVTALSFPRHSKLLSASTDNNIAVTRTRDWQLLSTIHVPVPKPTGRPSGDTFAPGEVPAGINDLAVHPSARLALTVGVGEKCMRLWNLVTGKKAAVLTFEKALLAEIGESKFRGGEARRVVWKPDGEEFAVAFERGLFIYGLDGQVRGTIKLGPREKLCQIRYVPRATDGDEGDKKAVTSFLAVSTEDGRILFYDTRPSIKGGQSDSKNDEEALPSFIPTVQLGQNLGPGHRIKDFEILPSASEFLFVTASSAGLINVWRVDAAEFYTEPSEGKAIDPTAPKKQRTKNASSETNGHTIVSNGNSEQIRQIGTLCGSHEINRRVTCMVAFIMSPFSAADEAEQPSPGAINGQLAPPTQAEDDAGEAELEEQSESGQESDRNSGSTPAEDSGSTGSAANDGDNFNGFDE